MNRNSIRWRLPVSYAVIALLAALSLGTVMLLALRGYYAEEERQYLHGNATVIKPVIEQILQSKVSKASLQDQVRGLSFLSQAQIRLLDTEGNVLADSGVPDSDQVVAVSGGAPFVGNVMFSVPANPPAQNGDHVPLIIYRNENSQPLAEIKPFERPLSGDQDQISNQPRADIILRVNASPYGYGFVARGETATGRRSSQIVSVPLTDSIGQRIGMLEFSKGPTYGADVILSVTLAWLIASIFAISLAAIIGWFMSQRVTRPVLALENATRQMEHGNLSVRVNLLHEKQEEFISLANSFNGMADQVEKTIATLRAFVADAAHELHTPLTALKANLELARDEIDEMERSRFLRRAQEQGQRLEMLIQSLLDLSRIEVAEAKTSFAPVDISQLTRETGELFASRAEQSERIFTMTVPDEVVLVYGNESQLRRVIGNLLENAFKFTPIQGNISLTLECMTNDARLIVSDSGIGIPPEDLPYLFERFHRARNVSAYPGSGLGLAIVNAITNLHRGTIIVRSDEKQGTVVIVTLPLLSS